VGQSLLDNLVSHGTALLHGLNQSGISMHLHEDVLSGLSRQSLGYVAQEPDDGEACELCGGPVVFLHQLKHRAHSQQAVLLGHAVDDHRGRGWASAGSGRLVVNGLAKKDGLSGCVNRGPAGGA